MGANFKATSDLRALHVEFVTSKTDLDLQNFQSSFLNEKIYLRNDAVRIGEDT